MREGEKDRMTERDGEKDRKYGERMTGTERDSRAFKWLPSLPRHVDLRKFKKKNSKTALLSDECHRLVCAHVLIKLNKGF